jgi:hypothetical protein
MALELLVVSSFAWAETGSSCPPLCCFSVAIQTFLLIPMCLPEVFHPVSHTSHCFLPPFHGGS